MTRKTLMARLVSAALIIVTVLALLVSSIATPLSVSAARSLVNPYDGDLNTNFQDYFNSSVIYRLPSTVKDTDEISLIVQVDRKTILDAYEAEKRGESITEFALSSEAASIRNGILSEKEELLSMLNAKGINYLRGADYSTILSGFEIKIKAADFEKVCITFGSRANVIVGEVYKTAETKLVENDVNVYETGIFDSSSFKYNGEGMVIAVLDTGLDYYHTAFLDSNFKTDRNKLGLTFDEVASLIGDTVASEQQSGLTASDVYISDKVPFGFDYADHDSDVYPMTPSANDHGTHVSGVIAGHDDVITGVAPGAQLVEMKIFSDTESSARSSWILSALEDCVVLGVDVINMSIGTSCGFSREMDKEQISGVYDRIRAAGISMVVAASNSFNSTYGSEKNGNLPLTSNPDSATIGSPATYKGALSVASISGVRTPYMLYGDRIIYFTESTDRVQEEKNFFDEIFSNGESSLEVEYVTIPGAGRSADYQGIDVTGKIVLVRRGSTTFEEKANVAQAKGAAGVIIYNNVSGEIKMNVGDTTIPVCSIRQDDGEILAAAKNGVIKISRSQTSGPFMSDFSSWGPTPDLQLKPEITAHGGSILSAVPGQAYDRLSGTSMATPNMSGVTALMRQYVIERFPEMKDDPVAITALVKRLMMSTADIVFNVNGLPYSVRKQGAGLANLNSSAATTAYILTYDRKDGSVMDTSKIELGDDPAKKGVYTLKFSVVNFGSAALTYDVSAYVMTEGVSDTKTSHGETTVTEQGYLLSGAGVVISSVKNGSLNGSSVTVGAGQTADVTVTVTLSDADKKYMDDSFENGMYVEGFVVLDAAAGTEIDLSIPYLGFYGDWTEAPIFDLDYFETNKDEIDDAIDVEDKTLPDAYATRPIGGISDDYVSYLGSYYFLQDPSTKLIAADRKYIALSNQTDTINSLRFVWAGLLRNAATIEISIVEDATGEVIFTKTEKDVRKSYGDGGTIYPANVKIEFSSIDANLKNNTEYTVKLKAYLDYGDGGVNTNDSNTFEFPIVTDFEAPAVTDVEYYTEYDKSAKKNRLFARLFVYDNHYSMAMQPGYVGRDGAGDPVLYNFDQYMTPIYSGVNSTTEIVYELTDYVDDIRNSSINSNCFTVAVYDYALNLATYEISLPDDFVDFYFEEEAGKGENQYALTLSPNEVYTLAPKSYPGTEWTELLDYTSSRSSVVRVVNNKIVAVKSGVAMITASDENGKTAQLTVKVLAEGEPGYKRYDKPVTDNFYLTGYYTDKAYYFAAAADREIGETGNEMKFPSQSSYSLSMYPSEAVTIRYKLDAYFPDDTSVVYESSNENLVNVDANGRITAKAEGFASVTVRVKMDGKNTYYSKTINIEVKDPYVTSGPSLTHYFGLGGRVEIPKSLALTKIGQFAFSNFEYIPKDPSEITEEDPDATRMWFIGDNTIEEVIIPEGVETIESYAFANLTALKKVVLPSTIKMIDLGAFYGCSSLEVVEGIENVQFINQNAFANCALEGTISLDSAIVLTHYAFANNRNLKEVVISDAAQSIGQFAFAGCSSLETLTVNAEKFKLGAYAFRGCTSLKEVSLNIAVIPAGAFDGCSSLESFTFGKDVAVIGEYAFRDTKLKNITVAEGNATFSHRSGDSYILNKEGNEIIFVASGISGVFDPNLPGVTSIGNGAFSGNKNITSVILPNVTNVKAYAFADCQRLTNIELGALKEIGDYAFFNAQITSLPTFDEKLGYIGKYAFAGSELTSVVIPNGMTVGEGAFYECQDIVSIIIGSDVILGDYAFRLDRETNYKTGTYRDEKTNMLVYYYIYTSALHSLEIGDNVIIGTGAFMGASELESVTLGEGAVIGNEAFYNADKLRSIDLSKVKSIGALAFSGDVLYDFLDSSFTEPIYDENGYIYRFFAPDFVSVDLSGVESIGEGAFEYCHELTTVKLGEKVTEISELAFDNCVKLSNINLSGVKVIGDSAFAETALISVDLSGAEKIGEYAFVYNDALTDVKLGGNTEIAEGAFAYCSALEDVSGLDKAIYIGDYAFAYTAITKADLSGATYIGEFAFIKEEMTDFEVKLGDKLESMGDNPFAMCSLKAFSSTVTESFNGKDYTETVYTYDISDSVKIIDGLLYRVVPNGLELISYAGNAKEIRIADKTVRIGAMAFAGADITTVYLPKETASIGHKAFFDCENLALVVFSSYRAPVLEEEYDIAYFQNGENLPATGKYQFLDINGNEIEYPGLEIVPYFMWNATSNATNVYYGANFLNYIGHIEKGITMVRPANGQFYDTFIYGQYFDARFDGASAADKTTLDAIAAINRIPEKVSLSDKAIVLAAKEAYDKIATYEQLALIGDALTSKLTQAEKRIRDLEYLANQDGMSDGEPEGEVTPEPDIASETDITMALVIIGVTFAMFGLLYLANRKKSGENAQKGAKENE